MPNDRSGPGDNLGAALEPVVDEAVRAAGFDLDALTVQVAGRRRLVKVVVDGDDGVGLDEVAQVSRAVAASLDEHDEVLGGPYTLEVTSPGVERPLSKPRHWRRVRFRLVRVRTPDGGSFTGRVGAADDDPGGGVQMLVNDKITKVGYADVEHAVVEIEFKQPPADEMAKLEASAGGSSTPNEEESR